MASASDLTSMVPGFDFLQGLLKNAGAGLPAMGQWVAPTLNPEELEKRIQELKTVQFWLDQNAKLLATTIQALEVQRMTLSTLQSLNLPLLDLGNMLKIKPLASGLMPETALSTPAPTPAPAADGAQAAKSEAKSAASAPASATSAAAVDPLQWWGALTKQFGDLATQAFKDSAVDTAQNLAGAVAKQSMDSAKALLKKSAAGAAKKVARKSRR